MTINLHVPFDSKSADLILEKDECRTWWFIMEDYVLAIDYLPYNYPDLEIITFANIEEARKRFKEMVNKEGWNIATVRGIFLMEEDN